MAHVARATPRSLRASRAQHARALGLVCVLSLIAVFAHAHGGHEKESTDPVVAAPGYGRLDYDAPEAGSYSLPVLSRAADGVVLREDGGATSLYALYGNQIAVLSFIYASCSDTNGCPLASAVLHRLKSRLRREHDLAEQLKLVSLSFDPKRDTPSVMKRYGEAFLGPGPAWTFATTASRQELAPILAGYGQSIQPEYDERGIEIGTLSHVLRVYLIDREKRIRNIYGVAQLHPDTLLADIETLVLEANREARQAPTTVGTPLALRDARLGYMDGTFTTQSVELGARRGQAIDLVQHALTHRPETPLHPEHVALGRRLFFDRELSQNGTLSCAMCHIPEQGFTNNEVATPVGTEGRQVRRNAPTLLDVALRSSLFHDGRETRLEDQVWSPLLSANEMANPSANVVVARLRESAEYKEAFHRAFPSEGLTRETVGMALASYERTLISGPSAFDRWRYGGESEAISAAAKRGFEVFTGAAGCQRCHNIGSETASFEDGGFHNTGIGWRPEHAVLRNVTVAPGQTLAIDPAVLRSLSRGAERERDLGLYEITRAPGDRGRFRTPSLRNVALTAPYMHDGSLESLPDVIDHYRRGGAANLQLDPLIKPIQLSEREQADLVAFLEALTGDSVPALVRDAFAAQGGEAR